MRYKATVANVSETFIYETGTRSRKYKYIFSHTTDQDCPVFAYTFSIDAFIARLYIFVVPYENLFNVQHCCLSRWPDLIRIRAIHSCQF